MAPPVRRHRFAQCACALAFGVLAAPIAGAQPSFVERPIYSEPGTGLQMPPGCEVEPTWRARVGNSEHEVWVVVCDGTTRTWLLRRSLIEKLGPNQARLRFQVTDDRAWPGETAGDSVSVQCSGREPNESGLVVIGARWRASGNMLRLTSARAVYRADLTTQKFVSGSIGGADCTRYPEREAMLRRLQQAPR